VPEALSTRLYPDIASHGSLAVALRDLAAIRGLGLGSVRASPMPGWVLCGAELESEAGTVSLLPGSQERVVIAECWRRGVVLASGSTPELLPVARAAEAFLRGDSLADLRDYHGFLKVSDLAFAPEAGTEVEAQWRLMMTHPKTPVRRLVLAAAEQPAVRMLFPFTSHLALCFSRCTHGAHSHFGPRVWLAGRRLISMRAATLRMPSASATAMISLRVLWPRSPHVRLAAMAFSSCLAGGPVRGPIPPHPQS
jgi:hypothetical protein